MLLLGTHSVRATTNATDALSKGRYTTNVEKSAFSRTIRRKRGVVTKKITNILSVVATTSLGLSALALPSNAASPVRTSYYGCSAHGVLGKISVLPHGCAKGLQAVSGKFAHANFTNLNLAHANLSGANLSTTSLTGVSSGAIIGTPASLPKGWTFVKGYLVGPGAVLAGANLTGANLTGVNLTNGSLLGANLTTVNLSSANLSGVSLSNATLTGAIFTGAHLSGLISAYLNGVPAALPTNWQLVDGYLLGPNASIGGAKLPGITLTGANLSGIYLAGARLLGASFTNANLSGAVFANASLNNADMSGSNLTGANLSSADLEGINLTNANLTGVNLYNARWLSINTTGATFTSSTTCPDGVKYGTLGANC